ncbi:hypothetical protein ElyMa_000140000 [Elysia marginata]|uniref:Uncharacterized protein n=1 Tax=Elysia marginata TaxID=1093978 RepID=A0AAV4EQS4_9GAST|nr:hypothetical protein ElyMa_000140000 [Elysia marginata]
MLMVKDIIDSGGDGLEATPAIFMQLPLADAHRNHQVSIPVPNPQAEVSHHLLTSTHHQPVHHQQYHHHHQQQLPYTSWLPECFTVTTFDTAYITGWVQSEEEYLQVLEKHRHAFGCAFLAWSNDKERTFKAEADRRVMWKKDFIDPGCPLTVHHSLILACAYSDQSKGKPNTSSQQNLQTTDFSCLAPGMEESIIQVPSGFVQDGTSLEIQYFDAAHQYPELQSLIKPDETYIILVDKS